MAEPTAAQPLRHQRGRDGLAPDAARPARRRTAPADRGRDAGGGRAHRRRLLRRPAQRGAGARRARAARRRRDRGQRQARRRRRFAAQAADAGPARAPATPAFPSMARAPDDARRRRAPGGGQGGRAAAIRCAATSPCAAPTAPSSTGGGVAGAPARPGSTPPLLEALELKIGDALLLGDAQLRIARVIVLEPDRGAGFINFAPRVMIDEADLRGHRADPAGQPRHLPASRWPATARAATRGGAVRALGRRAARRPTACAACASSRSRAGRPEMRQTLDRAEKFLNLVALLAALLAAVAVAIAARDFAGRHLDDCAMLRVLGQTQRTIAWRYALRVRADRPGGQRARRAARLRRALRVRRAAGRPGRRRAAGARRRGRRCSAWAWA